MKINVKTMLKLGALAMTLFLAGTVKSNAVTTNLVQNIGIDLVLYEQGPTNGSVEKVLVDNQSIISALGTATSNSFSSTARLVLVSDPATSSSTAVQIWDGTNMVDVTSYFSASNSTLNVSGSLFAHGGPSWDRHPKVSGSIGYDIVYLTLGGPNLLASLDVNGLEVTTTATASNKWADTGINGIVAYVSGTGTDTTGNPAIVSGTITVFGDVSALPVTTAPDAVK